MPTQIDGFCDVCGATFEVQARRTFLGFHKVKCPRCDTELLYPLSTGYRVFYSLAAIGMAASFTYSAIHGDLAMPGLVGFAMLIGLAKDYELRRELAAREDARKLAKGPPLFGAPVADKPYVLRPSSYVIIRNGRGELAAVRTRAGLYLPGGGREDGEAAADVVLREAREECGLVIELTGMIGNADEFVYAEDENTLYLKRCTFFRARQVGTTDATEPDHELCWLGSGEALTSSCQRWAVQQDYPVRT